MQKPNTNDAVEQFERLLGPEPQADIDAVNCYLQRDLGYVLVYDTWYTSPGSAEGPGRYGRRYRFQVRFRAPGSAQSPLVGAVVCWAAPTGDYEAAWELHLEALDSGDPFVLDLPPIEDNPKTFAWSVSRVIDVWLFARGVFAPPQAHRSWVPPDLFENQKSAAPGPAVGALAADGPAKDPFGDPFDPLDEEDLPEEDDPPGGLPGSEVVPPVPEVDHDRARLLPVDVFIREQMPHWRRALESYCAAHDIKTVAELAFHQRECPETLRAMRGLGAGAMKKLAAELAAVRDRLTPYAQALDQTVLSHLQSVYRKALRGARGTDRSVLCTVPAVRSALKRARKLPRELQSSGGGEIGAAISASFAALRDAGLVRLRKVLPPGQTQEIKVACPVGMEHVLDALLVRHEEKEDSPF